jgi:hypothetical protein
MAPEGGYHDRSSETLVYREGSGTMGRIRTSRPSPAIVVAVLALVAALAGTAAAGPDTSISAVTKAKVKRIAGKEIEKKAPGLSVAHAASADSATNATSAVHADSATNATNAVHADSATNATSAVHADSANPIAYARVESAGGVTEADSKGISDTNVTREGTADYCFSGLGFAFKGAQVTVDFSAAATDEHAQFSNFNAAGCAAAGTQATVSTFNNTGAADAAGFFIMFYN